MVKRSQPHAEQGRATTVKRKPGRRHRGRRRPAFGMAGSEVETTEFMGERISHTETGPPLTGGDVDADWQRAYSSGEEAVGGSVATPDQDVVDEIGRALGVEQAADAPVRTSAEILGERDRLYWRLERKAAGKDPEK